MAVKIAIFPLISALGAIHGIRSALESLKETGSDVTAAKGVGPKAFFDIMGLENAIALDKAAGGEAYGNI
ncbi:hypothetical protein M422DRAFT_25893 [Sphaerobolus stellatus SS14]|nr:hypothetical protein M422DRAFT_25893 [Sphaerobolus stellatus SS14]